MRFHLSRLAERKRFVRFRSGERNHHADAAVKGYGTFHVI